MKEYIQHLVKTNFEEVVKNTILNCHSYGTHSIMFNDLSGKRIRLFVALPGNDLAKNNPFLFFKNDMSVGYHAHHCDITLHVIMGKLTNVIAIPSGYGPPTFKKFKYKSSILNDKPGFEFSYSEGLRITESMVLEPHTEPKFMQASVIHTVFCRSDEVTAWFVYEGKEDPDYKPYTWSNKDLSKTSFKGLYRSASEKDVIELLTAAGIDCKI